jgi:hypothetical protein
VEELFDVFRKTGADSLRWIGADSTLEKAVARAREDMKLTRVREYLILDSRTGSKTVIKTKE